MLSNFQRIPSRLWKRFPETYTSLLTWRGFFSSLDDIINVMLGDLQRIKLYPAKGFQIEQHIPDEVWSAFEKLVQMGFDKHLIKT